MKNRFLNIASALLLLCLIANFGRVWAGEVPKFDAKSFTFQTGQIIAISEMNSDPSTVFFEAGTGSRFGHIGIMAKQGRKIFVYEANPPQVQRTPLEDFIARSLVNKNKMVTVVELVQPLTKEEGAKLIEHMHREVANETPYNFSMVVNPDSVNCSEFVMKAFKAIGRNGVGEIETVSEMNLNSMGGALAALWERSGPLPKPTQKVISPVSIVNSKQVRVLASNLPVDKLLSDFEILSAWIDGGGIESLANLLEIDGDELMAQAKMALEMASKVPYRAYPKKWREPSVNIECYEAVQGIAEPTPKN